MNVCVICGREFEPYRGRPSQKTCCKECRDVYVKRWTKKYLDDHTEQRKKQQLNYRRRTQNGRVICRICGKPIMRRYVFGEGKAWMHEECVFNDCINTLKSGGKLSHKQLLRLDARGYSKAEFCEEFYDKIHDQD